MNINLTLTCDTCGDDVDLRIGMSNRDVQPLSFACPGCGVPIDVTITMDQPIEFKGAQKLPDRQLQGLFDNTKPFLDLHLDFPVWSYEYVPGMTPYLAAVVKSQGDKGTTTSLERMAKHSARLDQLNAFASNSGEVRKILKLYWGKNRQLFEKLAGKFIGANLGPSRLQQDFQASLYTFVSFVFLPFVDLKLVQAKVDDFGKTLMKADKAHNAGMRALMDRLHETNFLTNLQRDCLELYPSIYEAELPLRPALFLDFVPEQAGSAVPAKISLSNFRAYKDLYKDISEVFGRQLILVAALNNVIHRGDADAFAGIGGGAPLSSLDKMADKTLSDRFKYLDDCWYPVTKDVVDTSVRNAIAHYTTQYDEATQLITYFPEKEGLRQEQAEEMYLLDFMRMILLLFREMHSLHHLIKAMLFYDLLVIKREAEQP